MRRADVDELQDDARLARILTRPPEVQAARLRNFAALAERHLRPGARGRIDTPRFVVVTDSPDPQTPSTIAADLEAVFGELGELFADKIPPQTAHFKQVDYVDTDRSSFQALAGELTVPEWANGFYAAPGLSAFHLETGSADAVLAALIHETVHAYTDQHLARPGRSRRHGSERASPSTSRSPRSGRGTWCRDRSAKASTSSTSCAAARTAGRPPRAGGSTRSSGRCARAKRRAWRP